jgi:hypothetical protein
MVNVPMVLAPLTESVPESESEIARRLASVGQLRDRDWNQYGHDLSNLARELAFSHQHQASKGKEK